MEISVSHQTVEKGVRRTAIKIKFGDMSGEFGFSQSASGGKIFHTVRKTPGKSYGFSVFRSKSKPMKILIFIEVSKKSFFDTQMADGDFRQPFNFCR